MSDTPEMLIGSTKVKTGFAEMFKGGVIMDVMNVEQVNCRRCWCNLGDGFRANPC